MLQEIDCTENIEATGKTQLSLSLPPLPLGAHSKPLWNHQAHHELGIAVYQGTHFRLDQTARRMGKWLVCMCVCTRVLSGHPYRATQVDSDTGHHTQSHAHLSVRRHRGTNSDAFHTHAFCTHIAKAHHTHSLLNNYRYCLFYIKCESNSKVPYKLHGFVWGSAWQTMIQHPTAGIITAETNYC